MRNLAYLDAGSGSMILAAIAGGVAGIGVVFKTFGRRIMAVFSPSKRAALKAEQEAMAAAEDAQAAEVADDAVVAAEDAN